jgi:glycosyltransferase involved in cell wall biosynthesis
LPPPRISIVTATFNRSNILGYTIASVLAQTITDWEMLVIGDACTDDTEAVVSSFGDPRIRFVNLALNSGEQATPNNEGVRLAQGEFIAFLNHDDLWTPDHLASCLDAIGDGEFVSALTLYVVAAGTIHLGGVCPNGTYDPSVTLVASSWFLRRSLAREVGPWRPARAMHSTPSQEWVFRVWRAGHRMRSTGRPTVLAIPSGQRAGSYAQREATINAEYARMLRDDPELTQRLLLNAAMRLTADAQDISVRRPLIRAARNVMRRAAILFGVHPHGLQNAVEHRRKGGLIDALRRTRGLPPLRRERTS